MLSRPKYHLDISWMPCLLKILTVSAPAPQNCLSVFDYFVGLAFNGLKYRLKICTKITPKSLRWKICPRENRDFQKHFYKENFFKLLSY